MATPVTHRTYQYTGDAPAEVLGLRVKPGDVQELPVALVEEGGTRHPDFRVVKVANQSATDTAASDAAQSASDSGAKD